MVKIAVVSWVEAQAALSSIRRTVFIEEQAVPEELEWDGEDEHALHVLVAEGGEPVGCGRMLVDGQIGRMAVLKEYRDRGVGRLILKTLLMEAEKLRRSRVFVNAQTHAAGFYAKYGFIPVGGEFPDAGISHLRLEKTLDNFSETLNGRFAIPGRLRFRDSFPGLPVAEITTPDAMVRVAVQGGQVLEWQPSGQKPVLWVSKAAVYQFGKGVRGGVPVCFPWFGQQEGKVTHGFVRTRMWEVREARIDLADTVLLRLGIHDDESTRALWDHAFDLELIVIVGAALKMELVTRNSGSAPFTFSGGLHSYFRVGDIRQTRVHGLDGTAYLDKTRNFQQFTQSGPVTFSEETDRIYLDTTADCLIEDPVSGRTLRVAKSGSRSTVIWNPWTEREKSFADMAAGEHREMLCVETVNAGPGGITLGPGGRHSLVAFIGID